MLVVYFPDVHFNHRGVIQLLLGEDARSNQDGFKFNKEGGKREWVGSIQDIVDYNEGVTADDIDEEFIEALLLNAIKDGAESNPQGRAGGGGDSGGCGGFGA